MECLNMFMSAENTVLDYTDMMTDTEGKKFIF